MQPERLGAQWQYRLSFARILLRNMCAGGWSIERSIFDIDEHGAGEAVYVVTAGSRRYQLVLFAANLSETEREDRVIAARWDAAAVLIVGDLSEERMAFLRANVPKQEYGRAEPESLVWTRANRSSRFFNYTVDCLANGHQPDPAVLAEGGYLFRSTAFYGNTKFGLAPFRPERSEHPLDGSFQLQMLAGFLLREYSVDLADHLAKKRNPQAVSLRQDIRQYLGLGNATGMGLVPFSINNPGVTHTWCYLKEHILAEIRSLELAHDSPVVARAAALFESGRRYFEVDPKPTKGLFAAAGEMMAALESWSEAIRAYALSAIINGLETRQPWASLTEWSEANQSIEAQELLNSCLIELYPEIADPLASQLNFVAPKNTQTPATIAELQRLLQSQYGWSTKWPQDHPDTSKHFWYFSQDSEEPLIGRRGRDPGESMERPLDISQRVQALRADLASWAPDASAAAFLFTHPEHRLMIERAATYGEMDYAEVHTNLLAADCIPLHLQRFQLAQFGMARFDPQSIYWVRVTLFQGAPTAAQVAAGAAPDWFFPTIPELDQGHAHG